MIVIEPSAVIHVECIAAIMRDTSWEIGKPENKPEDKKKHKRKEFEVTDWVLPALGVTVSSFSNRHSVIH